MNDLKKCFCILGYPGSGKGVQAQYLARAFGLLHIDIGEHLRRITREKSPFGKDIALSVDRKNVLVPDEVIRSVLLQAWERSVESGVIIDGAPRRLGQKSIIEDVARERGAEISGIIFLTVDTKKIAERIRNRVSCVGCSEWFVVGRDVTEDHLVCPKCGETLVRRQDDTPEGIKRRVAIFENETMPVIEAYRKEGKLIEIDANSSIEETRDFLERALHLEG